MKISGKFILKVAGTLTVISLIDYLVKNIDKTISVVTAQDGSENVKIQLLVPRYTTTDGVDWLTKKAENLLQILLRR